MKLVLFDIDGTLIDPAGAGSRSADAAFPDLFAIEDAFHGIRMAGKTDIRIMKEGLAAHGLPLEDGVMGRHDRDTLARSGADRALGTLGDAARVLEEL